MEVFQSKGDNYSGLSYPPFRENVFNKYNDIASFFLNMTTEILNINLKVVNLQYNSSNIIISKHQFILI